MTGPAVWLMLAIGAAAAFLAALAVCALHAAVDRRPRRRGFNVLTYTHRQAARDTPKRPRLEPRILPGRD